MTPKAWVSISRPGIDRVILTAPGKGALKNIVHGINHGDISADDKIISAASCTTNAIVPVLKAVNDQYGIINGHVETVHSFTNDQNLIDNFHKGSRRGRAAPLNMVITETGAATAAAKALPVLKGKLTGNAIRVPTPNVSMAILNLNRKGHQPRRDQRVPAPDRHALGTAQADRLRQLPKWSPPTSWARATPVWSTPKRPSATTTALSCTSGTTTSSVIAARWCV